MFKLGKKLSLNSNSKMTKKGSLRVLMFSLRFFFTNNILDMNVAVLTFCFQHAFLPHKHALHT